MSRSVLMWTLGGLIFGILLGVVIGTVVNEGTMPGWVVISGIGGALFFGFWGYANTQQMKVRDPGKKK